MNRFETGANSLPIHMNLNYLRIRSLEQLGLCRARFIYILNTCRLQNELKLYIFRYYSIKTECFQIKDQVHEIFQEVSQYGKEMQHKPQAHASWHDLDMISLFALHLSRIHLQIK